MTQSLGIHRYRNLPILPESQQFIGNNNSLPYQYWLGFDFDRDTVIPVWIEESGEEYDSYKIRTVVFFKARAWCPPGFSNTNFRYETTYGAVAIVAIPDDIQSPNGIFNFPSLAFKDSLEEPVNPMLHPDWVQFDAAQQGTATVLFRPLDAEFFRKSRPNYESLISGYKLDDRIVPSLPTITLSIDTTAQLSYYRENKLEQIADLRSNMWIVKDIQITKDLACQLPIVDCVLGTLYCDNPAVTAAIKSLPTVAGQYQWGDLFPENIASLFIQWKTINDPNYLLENDDYASKYKIRKLAANNNAWGNADLSTNLDINFNLAHPMFAVDLTRSFNWHLSPQNQGIGTLIMDSIRTIELLALLTELHKAFQATNYQSEDLTADPPVHFLDWYLKNIGGKKIDQIHAALDAETWGVNPLDPKKIRVDNLGWRINRANEVLGIRVKPNGKIDEALEKTTNRRLHAEGSESNDPQKYGINGFGSEGMMVRVLPNKFSPNGTVSGGYCKVKDIPQLFAEFHEQANAAMGYQEGTAIEIQLDGQTYRYPNQLALMTELLITAKQTATYSKGAFFSSLIGEQSIKEVMGGLGLRTVDRFLEFKVAGKTVKLYYKGISASQSIRRKLSAIATNIGTVIGNII